MNFWEFYEKLPYHMLRYNLNHHLYHGDDHINMLDVQNQ